MEMVLPPSFIFFAACWMKKNATFELIATPSRCKPMNKAIVTKEISHYSSSVISSIGFFSTFPETLVPLTKRLNKQPMGQTHQQY